MPREMTPASPALSRSLGLFDATMMMVGIVIGSGIFLTTGIMAQSVHSPALLLPAWLMGGVLTLSGALTFAELGAAMPQAGGQYVFLREAYGQLFGFLFGWVLFLVSMGGSIAALAVGFGNYLGSFLPWLSADHRVLGPVSSVQLVAFVAVLTLSLVNLVGVGLGKAVQNSFSIAKLGAILVFVALAFTAEPVATAEAARGAPQPGAGETLSGFGVALIAVLWAFDGWHNVTYIAGEIRNPGRNLPRVLVGGTLVITALYLLVNYSYTLALPMAEMAGVVRIAERALVVLHGPEAARLMSAAILVSIFGALNGTIFAGARVYYAMARDGSFFRKVAEIHPRWRADLLSLAPTACGTHSIVLAAVSPASSSSERSRQSRTSLALSHDGVWLLRSAGWFHR